MTNHAGNEPTEAQVEAAAKAMWDLRKVPSDPEWAELEYGVKQEYRKDARAALVAAQGAAPQPACLNCDEPVAESVDGVGLRAERDAALAAIERVRALLQPTLGGTPTGEPADVCGCGKDYFPCDHAAVIIAALDGAPEPESVGELFPGTSEALDSLTSRKDKP